jgi:hypothetical protein
LTYITHMALNHITFTLTETNCCVHPVHDEFGGTGLAASHSVAAKEHLLCVPLHDCVVVKDNSPPSLCHRGHHPLCFEQVCVLVLRCRVKVRYMCTVHEVFLHTQKHWLQVLASLQSKWQLALPKPLLNYIDNRLLDSELRLAAMLAWMQLHVPPASTHNHWVQWFSHLPSPEDGSFLSTASFLELQILDSYAPHLKARALKAKANSVEAWNAAVAAAPHIWLTLPKLAPGTTAPNSFPLGISSICYPRSQHEHMHAQKACACI